MRKLLFLGLLLLFSGTVWAETFKFVEESIEKTKKPDIERKIQVDKAKDYLEITVFPKESKAIVYRVWPCGKIEKMEWKEISRNIETNESVFITYPATSTSVLR